MKSIQFAAICLVLAGCSSVNLNVWPFNGGIQERTRLPSDSTAYQCNANKKFFVRFLDNGSAAWIILPEREFRLNKQTVAGSIFTNGITTLDMSGAEISLNDGASLSFAGCKAASGN